MEKQLIPQLRFPEFEGEWLLKKMGEECNHISYGLTVRPKYIKEGISLISAREITTGVINYSDAPKISQEDFDKLSNKAKPKKGDVFLTKTGTIGLTAHHESDEIIAITQNIAVIRLNDININEPKYLLHYFKTRNFYKSAISKVNQSTIMDLQLGDIKKLIVPFPELKEQQKIASFLTDVDAKITQLTKKKSLLEQYKKGIMQKIFPSTSSGQEPELRFKPDLSGAEGDDDGEEFPKWEEKKLENMVNKIASGKIKAEGEGKYDVYGSTGIIGKSNDFSHRGTFLLIARVGANAGAINLVKGDFGVTDNTLFVEVKQKANIIFLKNALIQYNLSKLIFGSGQPLITGGQLKSLKINFPCIVEQTKIANFLSELDVKIEALNTKIEQSKAFKKGLLQQLFV